MSCQRDATRPYPFWLAITTQRWRRWRKPVRAKDPRRSSSPAPSRRPMPDTRPMRVQRELFLAAFGANVGATEPWVTDRLTSLLEEHLARAGETLFSAGDPPDFYYFLREGRVRLVREGRAP